MVHVRFITSEGEKKGIAMNGAGASSRSPIISNQASQREDKAALTMNAHSEFHLTSTKSERKVIARGCQKPCGVRKNATKTELHQSSIIVWTDLEKWSFFRTYTIAICNQVDLSLSLYFFAIILLFFSQDLSYYVKIRGSHPIRELAIFEITVNVCS